MHTHDSSTSLSGRLCTSILLVLLVGCRAPLEAPVVVQVDVHPLLERMNSQLSALDSDDPQLAARVRGVLSSLDDSLGQLEAGLDNALREAIAFICADASPSDPRCRRSGDMLQRWLDLALDLANDADDCAPPLSLNWDWHIRLLTRTILGEPIDEEEHSLYQSSPGTRLTAMEHAVSYHNYYGRELCAIYHEHLRAITDSEHLAAQDTEQIEGVLALRLGIRSVAGAALDGYTGGASVSPFQITRDGQEAAKKFLEEYVHFDPSSGEVTTAVEMLASDTRPTIPLGRHAYQSVGNFVVRVDQGHQSYVAPARGYLSTVLPYIEQAIAAACSTWLSTRGEFLSDIVKNPDLSTRTRLVAVLTGVRTNAVDRIEQICQSARSLRVEVALALDEYWSARQESERKRYAQQYSDRFRFIDRVFRHARDQMALGILLAPENVSSELIEQWVEAVRAELEREEVSYDETERSRRAHMQQLEELKLKHAHDLEMASFKWANTREVEVIRANANISVAETERDWHYADFEIRLQETLDTNRAKVQVAEVAAQSREAVAQIEAAAKIKAARISRKQAVYTSIIDGSAKFAAAGAGGG